jgi:hypothetical protein
MNDHESGYVFEKLLSIYGDQKLEICKIAVIGYRKAENEQSLSK